MAIAIDFHKAVYKFVYYKMIDGLYEMTEYMPELASEIFVNVKKKS